MLRRLLTWIRRGFCLQQQREEFASDSFLRIVKVQRWQHDETGKSPMAADAAVDLMLRPGEKGLSLYRLRKEDEADELASVFSLTLRDNPTHFEYVLFPASVLSGYRVAPVPVLDHPSFLSDRHHEIQDPSKEQLLRLAERILGSPGKKVRRIMKQQIVNFAVQQGLLERKELRGRVGERWRALIEKKGRAEPQG
jgi:hypothetical protein